MEFAVLLLLTCNVALLLLVALLLRTRVPKARFDLLVAKVGRSWYDLHTRLRYVESRLYNLEHPRRSA
jgi:hypothetical protein